MENSVRNFKSKPRSNSENIQLREQILTLQNLYFSYKKNWLILHELDQEDHTDELLKVEMYMKEIEEQINKLTSFI